MFVDWLKKLLKKNLKLKLRKLLEIWNRILHSKVPHLPCPFPYLFQPPFVNQDTFCCNCFLWLLRLLGLDPKILLNSHVIFSVKSDLTTPFNINPPLWVSLICLIFLWGTFLHPTHSVFYTCILFIVSASLSWQRLSCFFSAMFLASKTVSGAG